MFIVRDIFDFDIGYLAKSPCKTCDRRHELPGCAEHCSLLDRIHAILAKGISCSGSHPFVEP